MRHDAAASPTSVGGIGPGLLNSKESCQFVADLLRRLAHVPVILNALAMNVVLQAPHAGEMVPLSGQPKDDVVADAPALAQDMAQKLNAVIALKSATTFIGSGDVLAGERPAERPGRLGFLAREIPAKIPWVMHGI